MKQMSVEEMDLMHADQPAGSILMGAQRDEKGLYVPCFNLKTQRGQNLPFVCTVGVKTDAECREISEYVYEMFTTARHSERMEYGGDPDCAN